MNVLKHVVPTSEQLPILRNLPGAVVIRGAAGSGKTTAALLRLKFVTSLWQSRFEREHIDRPVEILVLTYNRTLKGYIEELARHELSHRDLALGHRLQLEVNTFAGWATEMVGAHVNHESAITRLRTLAVKYGKQSEFIVEEAQYLLGRFPPSHIDEYLECDRRGRGKAPRCERPLRESILDDVIKPYQQWKLNCRVMDFNDVAVALSESDSPMKFYDIVVVDEAQDLSSNEIRAINKCLAKHHSITYVLDGAQRIYSKGFSWREVGVNIASSQSFRLTQNFRNTQEIAAFIIPLLDGVDIGEDDGSLPNLRNCTRRGPIPNVIVGTYYKQLDWAMTYLRQSVNLQDETVAFLKPQGGAWFNELRKRLYRERLSFVELTRNDEWPKGPENIALCTMHSAKGLEFDHVIVLGLNDENTPHGDEPGDAGVDLQRRLLAMALARAKSSVVVGYKLEEASILVSYFDPSTFGEVQL